MADPKYQNLRYIAVGQADVYETGDLPESDQAFYETDEHQGTVETLLVDPKDAIKRFNKATIDSSGSNFSEEAVAGRKGYSVHYEIFPPVHKDEETVLQRVQRLKYELKEVQEAAGKICDDEVNPTTILTEVEELQHQLELFSTHSSAVGNKHDEKYGQLLNQLKAGAPARQSPKKSSQPTTSHDTEPNKTVFELHMNSTPHAEKEAHLEARISQLEMLLGSASDQKMLAESVGTNSLMDTLQLLSSKMHLLDEDNVNKVSARLQILLQTMSKVKLPILNRLHCPTCCFIYQ